MNWNRDYRICVVILVCAYGHCILPSLYVVVTMIYLMKIIFSFFMIFRDSIIFK